MALLARAARMKIRRLYGGQLLPPCEAQIHIPAVRTRTQENREWQQRRKGLKKNQCPQRATYVVDGKHLCRNHAGKAALEFLESQG